MALLEAALVPRLIQLLYAAPKGAVNADGKAAGGEYPTTWRAVSHSRPSLQPRQLTPANAKMAATLPRVVEITKLIRVTSVIAAKALKAVKSEQDSSKAVGNTSRARLAPALQEGGIFAFAAVGPLLARTMTHQLFPLTQSPVGDEDDDTGSRPDGLTTAERRVLVNLHEAAAYLLAQVAKLAPTADVFSAINDMFPLSARVSASHAALGWGAEVHQPMLSPILHGEPLARCAAAEALGAVVKAMSEKLTLAEEAGAAAAASRRLRSSTAALKGNSSFSSAAATGSFMALSQRLALVLSSAHEAIVSAFIDRLPPAAPLQPTTTKGDATLTPEMHALLAQRAALLNAAGSIAQVTPYSRCPTSGQAYFNQLLRSGTFFDSVSSPDRGRTVERIAALFCLTAAHRNKFAFAHVRAFYASLLSPGGSPVTQSSSPSSPSFAGASSRKSSSLPLPPTAASNNKDDGARTLASVVGTLPGLDALRVMSSLAKEHPTVFRAHWAAVLKEAGGLLSRVPQSGGPDDANDDGESLLETRTASLNDVLGNEIQQPTEALRAILYFLGPVPTAKYTEDRWVAELSGGTYLHSTAVNHGATVASDASSLAVDARRMLTKPSAAADTPTAAGKAQQQAQPSLKISKFAMPLPPAEAIGRGPSAGSRATTKERVAVTPILLRARYAVVEGIRRLGFRALAHIGDETLAALPKRVAVDVVAAVLEDGVREPLTRVTVDVVLTMQVWSQHYAYFANVNYMAMFARRIINIIDRNAASLAVVTASCAVALSIATRAPQIIARDAADGERLIPTLLTLAEKLCEVADDYNNHAQVAGNCLKALAHIAVAIGPDFHIATLAGNEEGYVNEVLTRINTAMAKPTANPIGTDAEGVAVVDAREAEKTMRRALACLAARECLNSASVRLADPQAAAAVLATVVDDMTLRPSFVERTAALRFLATANTSLVLQSNALVHGPAVLERICQCMRFGKSNAASATLQQVKRLDALSVLCLRRYAEVLVKETLGSSEDITPSSSDDGRGGDPEALTRRGFTALVRRASIDARLTTLVDGYGEELERGGVLRPEDQPRVIHEEEEE